MGLPSLSYPGNEGEPVRNFWYQEAPDPITPYQLGEMCDCKFAKDEKFNLCCLNSR